MTLLNDSPHALLAPTALTQLEADLEAELAAPNPAIRVLHRLELKAAYHVSPPAEVRIGVILDTESTGVDIAVDKIIELGMVRFEFCPASGQVYRVLGTFNQLEDPGMPIPAAASAVNGITDAMVAGKKINNAEVAAFIDGADVHIAHNAPFDRGLMERRFPVFENLAWGCSMRQVDWAAEGISSVKLDYIAFRLNFFFEAHRAEADCLALLEALQRPLPLSRTLGLSQILARYQSQDRRIWALDARFEKKDDLKKRGYRWGDGTNGTEKAWHTEVSAADYDAEIAWLKENIYGNRGFRVAVDTVDAFNRFSARPGDRNTVMG